MSGLGEQSLASFLADVGEDTPAPGGGSSSAVVLALGAALVEMCARLAGDPAAATRAGELRSEGLELAERELSSYAPVLEALRTDRADPSRSARVQEALLGATEAPLAIALAAAETAELGAAVARTSSPSVRGDAVTGVLMAEAAAAAAAGLVELNLENQPDAAALAQAREARGRARAVAAGV